MTGSDFAAPQFDHQAVHRHGHAPVTYGGADDALWVEFYPRQVVLGFASEQAGREVHEERVYVKIIAPGSNGKTVTDREAHKGDQMRFPRQWAFYQDKNKDVSIIGTPLTECTFINRTLAEDLKSVKIVTVEQLASLDDNMLQRLGPGYRQHKAKAVAYLDHAKQQAPVAKLAAENEALKQQVESLSGANADMMRRLEVLERTQLYQQPQQPPPHVQEQIERDVGQQPREQKPFFSLDQIPDARQAYEQQASNQTMGRATPETRSQTVQEMMAHNQRAAAVNKGGRPRGSKNKRSHHKKQTTTEGVA